MNWYRFHAFNRNSLYGWGSAEEADKFCDKLNEGRALGIYAAEIVSNYDVMGLGLVEGPESFNIADELIAARED